LETPRTGWLKSSRFIVGTASALTSVAAAALLASTGDAPLDFCGPPCLNRRIEVTLDGAEQVSAPKITAADDLVDRQLAWSAFDASAWLRRAALETARAGRFDDKARHALEMSYRVAPVDVGVARWRLAFLFQHWEEASAFSRTQARREIASLAIAPENRPALRAIERNISDPGGHLAFRLITDELSPG
jgi:hypothetical protein